MQLTLRKVTIHPHERNAYRVVYDGIEIGSISLQNQHVVKIERWVWAVDTMPAMDHGGKVPRGEAQSLQQATAAFREAFTAWRAGISDDLWKKNRDHIEAAATRHLKKTRPG